jgi:glucosamine 6-phosphate synthetase-like amidotransferase/phosphosugar isomerase protein
MCGIVGYVGDKSATEIVLKTVVVVLKRNNAY